MIQLLHSYQGRPSDKEAVRAYQRVDWGSKNGDAALIELGALHAPSMSHELAERTTYRDARIRTILERMKEYAPKFAVFYGIEYREFYEEIIGMPFGKDRFAIAGETVCALVPHPPFSRKKRTYWDNLAVELKRRVVALRRP